MKLNWGSGIGAVYILFVIATLAVVFIFMNQDVALESKDYYEKGIKYQEQIKKDENTKNLPEQLDISVSAVNVIITFPKIFKSQQIAGEIKFYRPSNSALDFSTPINADSSNSQSILLSSLKKGLWKIKIDWRVGETLYYNEKNIMVN